MALVSPQFLSGGGLLLGPTLVVSDLHLEKGTRASLRGRAQGFVPPYDTRETLQRLGALVAETRPDRLIFLGDTFDDVAGLARLDDADRRALDYLLADREIVWIVGNHDPLRPGSLPGLITPELELDGYLFRHEAEPSHEGPVIEVSGHFHPAAKVPVRGSLLRRSCFVEAQTRIILPALGAYTGGLNVLDPAFAPLRLGDFRVHVRGRDKVYTLPMGSLAA